MHKNDVLYVTSNLDLLDINTYAPFACLVVSPVSVDSYGFLFNCTTVGQASDLGEVGAPLNRFKPSSKIFY